MRVICVLRSGGEYRPEHVIRLRDQVAVWLDAPFACLSDLRFAASRVEVLPLRHGWPGWWAKMELFRPDIAGDLLYFDLDMSIVGDLTEMAQIGRLAIMRDVYRPTGLQSSVMYLPEAARAPVWDDWIRQPAGWMQRHRRIGDQGFLERHWLQSAARWQDALPGQVVSYKADVLGAGLPEAARVVAFHGKPRPWDVGW